MFELLAVVILLSLLVSFIIAIGLIVGRRKELEWRRRETERQFNAARWWHDNREGLKRLGVDEKEFQQLRMNEPWKPPVDNRGDINPPPKPDRRQRSTWVDRDLPDPPQRFA